MLSTDHPAASVTPRNSNAISVGQYHYVGLDDSSIGTAQNSQTISEANVQSTVANTDTEAANEALDDAVIEEGDEHRMDISGVPMASMMCVENPESFREIMCCPS